MPNQLQRGKPFCGTPGMRPAKNEESIKRQPKMRLDLKMKNFAYFLNAHCDGLIYLCCILYCYNSSVPAFLKRK